MEIDQAKQQKKEGKRKLSFERNRIAFERLQLAWARSCLTLIVIAIGVYEFYYERIEAGKQQMINTFSGRDFAISLIVISIALLGLSLHQHKKNLATLKLIYNEVKYSIAQLFSYFVLTMGLLLLVMTLIRG